MDSKKQSYNGLFWSLTTGAAVLFIGSAYYLFNLLNKEEELPEDEANKIEELKKESGGELTLDTAVQIMTITTKVSEEIFKKNNPDLDENRRKAINDQLLYEQLFQQSIQEKENAFMEASQRVLTNFGNFTFEDIQKVMQTVHPLEVEKLSHKYEKINFENDKIPDIKKVKEAFIYHGNKFRTEMRELQREMQQGGVGAEDQQYFFFRMMLAKTKIDDLTYIKYELTEQQMKFMLFEYNLLTDPDVRKVYEQMMSMEGLYEGFGQ